MPQLVDPLLAQHGSPRELYSSYSRNALETAKAIKSFAKLMQEPGSQETLKRAKDSRVENPEEIRPWMVTEHPDWLEVRTKDAEKAMPKYEEGSQDGEAASFPSTELVAQAMESFRTRHPGIEVSYRSGDPASIKVPQASYKRTLDNNITCNRCIFHHRPIFTSF